MIIIFFFFGISFAAVLEGFACFTALAVPFVAFTVSFTDLTSSFSFAVPFTGLISSLPPAASFGFAFAVCSAAFTGFASALPSAAFTDFASVLPPVASLTGLPASLSFAVPFTDLTSSFSFTVSLTGLISSFSFTVAFSVTPLLRGSVFSVAVSVLLSDSVFTDAPKAPLPASLRTSEAASSSTELRETFASIPFFCKKLNISLLCSPNSSASSCTFIFAMLSSISALNGVSRY